MKKYISTILILVVAFLVSTAKAQNLQFAKTLHQGWAFIENKGQLADEKGNLLTDIKYYGNDKGVNIYCRQNSLSFVFTKTTLKERTNGSKEIPSKSDVPEIEKVDYERMDMKFMGCNANAQILASGQKEEYLNFYLAHTPEEGITGVHQYEKLTYKNIYNNVDLILYVKEKGLKYEFIIHPGGNEADIRIKWEGTEPQLLESGGIKYTNDLVTMIESNPVSFLEGGYNIESKFVKNKDGSISFELGKYDKTKKVIIDPGLSWATYYGGSDHDENWNITTDKSGSIFTTGVTSSSSGIATSGAYQTSYGGNRDAYIAKISSNGSIQWATYYGGSGQDEGRGINTDDSGNVFIIGSTFSTGMSTTGAYQTSISGSADCFIAKFSSSGSRIWGTYYGGTDGETGAGIAIDNSGNVSITGYTQSSSNIATTGAYQTTYAGGSGDIFIARFSNSGSMLWATYYGASGVESGHRVTSDTAGNICIIGRTLSSSGLATTGAYQTSNAGDWDIIIAKFSKSGSMIWATYYGGANQEYNPNIALDLSGNVIIAGMTVSTSGIATTGAYQTSHGGGSDAFVAKFSSSGGIQWATYYGGSASDYGFGVATDNSGYIYITGETQSTSGISSSGAYQTSYAGTKDAFLTRFDKNGKFDWGTYYGGTDVDVGESIASRSGNIIISGYTKSTSGIATSGAYKSSYGGGVTDGFIAKFQFCASTNSTITKSVCDSFVLNGKIYKTSGTYKQYLTNSVKCDSVVTLKLTVKRTASTIIKTSCDSLVLNAVTYRSSGTYIQKITNAAGCDSVISLKLLIKISSDTSITKVSCDPYTLNAITYDSSGTYIQKRTNKRGCDSLITLNLTITKATDITLTEKACNSYVLNGITYTSSGTYTQNLTNVSGCDSTITLKLTIKESSVSTITEKACNSFSLNGTTYNSSGTFIQTLTNIAGCDSILTLKLTINKSSSFTIDQTSCGHFVLNGTTYNKGGTYTQMFTNKKGCDSTITLNLTINQNPDAHFSANVNKNKVTFIPAEMNAKTYSWDFGNGGTSIQKSPAYTYLSIGNYTVKLKITSNDDCENEDDSTISIQSTGDIIKNVKTGIILFPNPAKGEVYISGLTERSIITLMDAAGKIINVYVSDKSTSINTSNFSKGIYLLNISNRQLNVNFKLIVE